MAVIGEPGVGKSRLFLEFTQAPQTRGWLILEAGAVSSYGQATPYLPIIDLLKAYFQVEGSDDGRGVQEKVADKLLALDEALRPTLPAFLMLLDVPFEDPQWQKLDPPQRRQHTLEAVKRLLLRESHMQPVLVSVENLHWIDTETQAFLDSVIESLPSARMLLLLNYRPEYQHSWGNKTYYAQIRLDPLPQARAEELLELLLGHDASLQPLKQRLIERTEGTPFYLEESVWTLAETKALLGERGAYRLARALPGVQVPATVQAVLAPRIDRLPPDDKRLLQAAAVIGRDVPLPLLQAIADGPEEALLRGLAHLQAAEFLYELQLFPEHVYTFRHALTQEVAYQSLLQRTRQHYHRQIARALVERFPDTVATRPELLAHHYTEADLSEQAVLAWQRAGQRASERSANVEAIGHLSKGLEVLKTLPETAERAQQELTLNTALGAALMITRGYAAPEVAQAYARARELCHQLGQTAQLFPVLHGLWRLYVNRAELHTARRLGEQLLTAATHGQDLVLLLQAHRALGPTLTFRGELALARTHLEEGIALYDRQHHRFHTALYGQDPGVVCYTYVALALWLLGYPEQAWQRLDETLRLAQELAHPFSLAYALSHAAIIHLLRREARATYRRAEAVIALSRDQGFPFWLAWGKMLRGWAGACLGQCEEGTAELSEGLAAYQATGARVLRPTFLGLLAETRRLGGRAAEGLRVLAEARAVMDTTGEHWWASELHCLRGELLLLGAGGPRADAEACFHQALTVAHHQQAKALELRAAMSLARLRQQQGKRAEAHELLAPIYGWFTEGFDTADLQAAKALLEEVS